MLKDHVNALRPHGGGDCNELGMEGILRALDESNENSHIIVLTDAGCKDFEKKDQVMGNATLLNVKVHFFLVTLVGDVTMVSHTIKMFKMPLEVFMLPR